MSIDNEYTPTLAGRKLLCGFFAVFCTHRLARVDAPQRLKSRLMIGQKKGNGVEMTEGNLPGPYYQWTRKISGQTVNINLDIESAKKVKEWIQNNRSLRKLCRRLERTSLAVLQTNTIMGNT